LHKKSYHEAPFRGSRGEVKGTHAYLAGFVKGIHVSSEKVKPFCMENMKAFPEIPDERKGRLQAHLLIMIKNRSLLFT